MVRRYTVELCMNASSKAKTLDHIERYMLLEYHTSEPRHMIQSAPPSYRDLGSLSALGVAR